MGYSDCTDLEFAPIRTALQDTQPLKAVPRLSDAQLPAPGIDAVSGTMRPSSFDKPASKGGKEAHITMVYADWCGYSQKALPEWEELTSELDGTVQNGYTLIFKKIEEKQNKDLIKSKYSDVRGFPTYVVEIKENGQIVKKEMFNGIKKEDMKNKLMNILN
jgi:thiol-disulfide isomerase/thioredoxin